MNAKLFRSFLLTLFIVCSHTVHAMHKQNDQRIIQPQSLKDKYSKISFISYTEQSDQTRYAIDGVTESGEEDTLTLLKFKNASMLLFSEYVGYCVHYGKPSGQFRSQFEEIDPETVSKYWLECEALRAKKISE